MIRARRVLIVEDCADDAELVRRMLVGKCDGLERLEHVGTLAAALERLAAEPFDVALVDLGLPDGNGIKMLDRLLAHGADVAVVVLTGLQDEQLGLQAIARGAKDYLSKGHLDSATLIRALRYACARHELDRRLRESEAEHRALFDNSPNPAWVYDEASGDFLTVNDAAVALYGYSRDEFADLAMADLAAAPQAASSAVPGGLAEHRRKDGATIFVQLTSTAFDYRGFSGRIVIAKDVTAERAALEALAQSEQRHRELFEHGLGLICTHRLDGVLISVNPAASHALGYEPAELVGTNLRERVPEAVRPFFDGYLSKWKSVDVDTGVFYVQTRQGEQRIWEYHNRLITDGNGEPCVLGHAQDVTERRLVERQLKEQNIRDPLTGCYNRRYLHQRFADADAVQTWGCVATDLDHFKQINDTYGHQRGDEVLIAMARYLGLIARRSDAVVRMGGDEFVVVLPDATAEITQRVAARLADGAEKGAPCAFSLGWAVREGQESMEQTIDRADLSLYRIRVELRGEERRRR